MPTIFRPDLPKTVSNTLIYLAVGVNVKMFLALLLSGFFMRRSCGSRGCLLIYVYLGRCPRSRSLSSIHWMLNSDWGFINNSCGRPFTSTVRAGWTNRWLALGAVIGAYIWKWMPFWTVILLAGRMADSAGTVRGGRHRRRDRRRRFVYITFPLAREPLSHLHLLSTICTLGDFTTVYFVSGGGPVMSTHVLATLGIRDAFTIAEPRLGVAAVMSALPC